MPGEFTFTRTHESLVCGRGVDVAQGVSSDSHAVVFLVRAAGESVRSEARGWLGCSSQAVLIVVEVLVLSLVTVIRRAHGPRCLIIKQLILLLVS